MTTLLTINTGAVPNDPSADLLQDAMNKVVSNQNTTIGVADAAVAAAAAAAASAATANTTANAAQAAAAVANVNAATALASSMPVGVTMTIVDNTTLQLSYTGTDSISRRTFLALAVAGMWYGAPTAPVLSDILPYEVPASGTRKKYRDILWGAQVWTDSENGVGSVTHREWFDIEYDPATPVPPGGRRILVNLHAAGGSHRLGTGNTFDTRVVQPWINAGHVMVSAEMTHPASNPGTIHNSAGKMLQALRALAPLFEANEVEVCAFARSRGNLVWWQGVQADLAVPSSTKFVETRSSKLFAIYSISGQCGYETGWLATKFIVSGSRAAFLAANPNPYTVAFGPGAPPDTGVLRNGAQDVNAGIEPPHAMVRHEGTWWHREVTMAEFTNAAGAPGVPVGGWGSHHPDMGLGWRDAYRAAGWGHKIVALDEYPDSDLDEQMGHCVPWLQALFEGCTAVEAAAIACARARGGALVYPRGDRSGMAVNINGSGGTPNIGDPVGVITDGSYGIVNRGAGAAALGFVTGCGSTAVRPTLVALAGGQCGLSFGTVGSVRTMLPNDTTPILRVRCTDGSVIATPTNANNTSVTFGVPTLGNKTVGSAYVYDGVEYPNDEKIMRTFAWWQMGTADA